MSTAPGLGFSQTPIGMHVRERIHGLNRFLPALFRAVTMKASCTGSGEWRQEGYRT